MKKIILLSAFCISIIITLQIKAQNWNQIGKSLPTPYLQSFSGHGMYGYSVAIDGNYAVVGDESGLVFVLYNNGLTWTTLAYLYPSNYCNTFGSSVDISGDNIVVGAYWDNNWGYGSGSAYVFTKPSTGWVSMSQTAILLPSDYSSYAHFGNSVSISGNDIVVGTYKTTNTPPYVSHIGAAYVFTKPANGWVNMTQTAKLTASDGANYNYFGHSVSISGDNIVVGSYGINHGSAYVFTKPTAGWVDMTETAKLLPSDVNSCGYLGYSVSISDSIIVVGAPGYNGGNNSGAAYIFSKPLNGWVNMIQIAKILPSDSALNDFFGNSVDISGDNIVVGAYYDDDNGSNTGSAYVYTKPVAGWSNMTQNAKIKPSSGSADDYFGSSVSISNDNILVGKPTNSTITCSAFIFTKPGSGWVNMTQTQELFPGVFITNYNNYYGYSIATDGNYAVVGVPYYESGKGAAYLNYYDGTSWITIAKFTSSDREANDLFGNSVAISGDNVVVTAFHEDGEIGSAYIFTKPVSGWADMTQTAKISPSDGIGGDRFGNSVSIDGDVIVVGAKDSYGIHDGCAYVFVKPVTGWTNMIQTAKLTASDADEDDVFGTSVSISGDNVVIGAPEDFINTVNSGSAYIFTKPLTGWVNMHETAKIYASDKDNADIFGLSVSISGDNIVVGAPQDEYIGNNFGSAYVFTKPSSGWVNMTQTAKIKSSDAFFNDHFGGSVSISGNYIAIGVSDDDDNGSNSGSVYVYLKPAGGWVNMTQTSKITPLDGTEDDNFGYAVSISGDKIVVGVVGDNDNGNDAGSAYLFLRCADIGVTLAGDTFTSNATVATYQWLNCNDNFSIIGGATNQSYTPITSGDYAVEVIQNGCVDTSICINFVLVGISDNNNLLNITIHPSLATSTLYIDGISNSATAEVYDLRGHILLTKQLNTNQLDISSLANGLYFIKLSTAEGGVVRKFVKE